MKKLNDIGSKNLKIVWANPAVEDLECIEDYIQQDNPRAAIEVVLHVIERIEALLPENPSIGRAGRVFGTRELVLAGLPYIVVYQVRYQETEILRVLHSSQKWPDNSVRKNNKSLVQESYLKQ